MQCLKCQFENRENAKYCKRCGGELDIACPQCKTRHSPDSMFCDECGFDLCKQLSSAHDVKYSEPQSYTPKHLADKILTTRSSIEGERKLVTVLFADVADYTAMSEKLDPEEVHHIMDGCFKILMDAIHRYEGTINQFTGDGIMALFGAPVAHEDHAQRACHAALAVQQGIADYGVNVEKDIGVPFRMRMGINSGPVIVGSIGDDLRMDYTAVGDTTNLAARLENLTQPGTIMISGATNKLVRDYFELEPCGQVEVKGKAETLDSYKLLRPSEVSTRFEASVAKGLTRFVGRENSMTALMESCEKAQSGSGQVVGIVGEAGVGKSRLLLEFRNRIQNDVTYLEGRCIQFGGMMAFLPLLDVLRSYFDLEEGEREYLIKKKLSEKIASLDEHLAWTLSPFQDLLSLKVDDENWISLDSREKREKTFEALRDLFIRESQERFLVLTIEDLHWMDKSSEEFLGYFIDWLAGAHVLLLMLYRPEYTHPWGSKTYYNRIGLDQLTMQSSAALVQAMLGEGEVVPELRELILGRAAGNPLFMEELTHTLLENGSIEKKGEQFVLRRKPSDIQVPDTIQGIIAARMDRLEDNLKRTMQVASVIGRDFAFRILQSITDMREGLKSQLRNLQGLEFIYEKQLFPELEYIFKHAMTQEVAYNSLLQERRKTIHENVGRAIEKLYQERLEEFYEMLAYHYSKSGNLEKTYYYLKQSGLKAMRHHSVTEALISYQEALHILRQIPETEDNKREQLEIIRLAALPIVFMGYPEGAMKMFKRAEEISLEFGDQKGLAWAYSTMARSHSLKMNITEAAMYSEKAHNMALESQDLETLAYTATSISMPYFATGLFYKTPGITQPVISMLENTGRKSDYFGQHYNVYSWLCAICGSGMGFMGNFTEAQKFLEKGLQNAVALKDLATVGCCELYYAITMLTKGDWNRSKEHIQSSMRHSEEVNFVALKGISLAVSGYAYTYLKDYEATEKDFKNCFSFMNETGIEFMRSRPYLWMGQYYYETDDYSNAQKYFEKAFELAGQDDDYFVKGHSLIYLGQTLGIKKPTDFEKAEKHIHEGIKDLKGIKMKPVYSLGYLALGELYANNNRNKESMTYLKKAENQFREMGMDFWLARTREVLEKV